MKRHLKRVKRFVMRYWLAISVGMIGTAKAAELAYSERGYMAFGGEYLVLPVVVMGVYLTENLFYAVVEIISDEEEYRNDSRKNSGKNVGHHSGTSESHWYDRRSS